MSIIWGDVCAVINKMLLKIWTESLFWYLVEDQTKKAVATHSSTLAWKIPWTEEPGRLQVHGIIESDMTERLHFPFSLSFVGEGNGNPLQCSCLGNPRDRGAWWAAVYGVAQSQTLLKQLSSSSRRSSKGNEKHAIGNGRKGDPCRMEVDNFT